MLYDVGVFMICRTAESKHVLPVVEGTPLGEEQAPWTWIRLYDFMLFLLLSALLNCLLEICFNGNTRKIDKETSM